ncbi:MAG: hypothetical protein J4F36_13220, partial [Nitrosopumilaceae archaeon]|nr:hypothetical protein [Nitrosopumilaceae archaeon]
MENQQIFKVKFDNIPSELQFNDDNMSCLTGDTVHFEVPYDKIRAYEFQKFTEDEGIFKIPFDINETTVYDVN